MTIDQIKSQIKNYLERELNFSALFLCRKIIEHEDSSYWKFQYANILRMCSFFKKSEQIFSEIPVEKIPDQYKYYYHLYRGQLFQDSKKFHEAKIEYEKCMEFENVDTVPYVLLSSILLGEENNDAAIKLLEKALDRDGDIDEVLYNLANRYAVNDKLDLALKTIKKCLDLNPAYPNAKVLEDDLVQIKTLQDQKL